MLGELHRGRADRPGGAVDEHALPVQRARLPQARQRQARAVADRGRLLEAHARRHVRDRTALADADELGVGAGARDAEDAVADRELRDGGADRFDLAGELDAEDPLLRSHEAR